MYILQPRFHFRGDSVSRNTLSEHDVYVAEMSTNSNPVSTLLRKQQREPLSGLA